MKKTPNLFLITGLVLLSFFVLLSLFGPMFAPYDLDDREEVEYTSTEDGDYELNVAPHPPSAKHPFGSDKWGYDILTKMLHGAKYTVFTVLVVASIRVVFGTAFGVMNAVRSKRNQMKKTNFSLFNGIPIFIIIYFALFGITFNSDLSTLTLVILEGSLLAVLGIPGVYHVIYNKTIELKKKTYVSVAKTLGGSSIHLSRKHIFPGLKGNLIILVVSESIQVLHVIGQLGIFNLFLGGTYYQTNPLLFFSITNEWSGLIGQSRSFIYSTQWVILYPLAAYLLFLLSFYLLSKGLNTRMEEQLRRTSHM
ncbi:ABC transporter permease subunit [Pseudalkalibacillus sp. SCS-8]|uniref:ABC transporter permease subunit n=1 Tax=Pseudalkalibacillus nanhaiensis TaxID=3115291 RepID=UPI0032DA2128